MVKKIAFSVLYLSFLFGTMGGQNAHACPPSSTKPVTTPKKQQHPSNFRDIKVIAYISDKYNIEIKTVEKYYNVIKEEANKAGIDPLIIVSMIEAESSFNAKVRSKHGAVGLMQLLPATARNLGTSPSKLKDYRVNIRLGVMYLSKHYKNYNSLKLAITAYNQGVTRVNNKRYTLKYYKKVIKKYNTLNEIVA